MRYPFSTKIALLQQCVTLLVLKLDIGTILTSVWKKFSLNNNVNAVVLGRGCIGQCCHHSSHVGRYCSSIPQNDDSIDQYILPRTTAFPQCHRMSWNFKTEKSFRVCSNSSSFYYFHILINESLNSVSHLGSCCNKSSFKAEVVHESWTTAGHCLVHSGGIYL